MSLLPILHYSAVVPSNIKDYYPYPNRSVTLLLSFKITTNHCENFRLR